MRQIDADKFEREITLAYIETCRGLTLEQIDAVARFSAKVISIIGHTPTADAEPTKHGRWIVCDDLYKTIDGRVFDGYRECSVCGEMYPYFPEHNYCPNCGAIMDEVEE